MRSSRVGVFVLKEHDTGGVGLGSEIPVSKTLGRDLEADFRSLKKTLRGLRKVVGIDRRIKRKSCWMAGDDGGVGGDWRLGGWRGGHVRGWSGDIRE